MYRALIDGYVLYDDHLDGYELINPVLILEAGKAGSFTCKIPVVHPAWGVVQKLVSFVEIYKDNRRIFRGRVVGNDFDIEKTMSLRVEGEMALLNDSVVRPYYSKATIEDYLTMMLNNHNAQVEASKHFELGEVTVQSWASTGLIVRSATLYPTTWQELDSKLSGYLSGFFVVRWEDGVRKLDYYEDSPYYTQQTIEFGQNVLDLTRKEAGEDVVSALIPLGYQDEETGNRLTIADVNDGLDYVFDQDAVDRFGWIFKVEEWQDVTLPENLKSRAISRLQELIKEDIEIDITAVDLSLAKGRGQALAIDDFNVFEYVRVKSDYHSIDADFLIQSMQIRLDDPASSTMKLGTKSRSMITDKIKSDQALEYIRSDYLTNEQMTQVKTTMEEFNSLITQTAQQIEMQLTQTNTTVDGLDTLIQTLQSTLSQTAEGWTFEFDALQKMITEVDGDSVARFDEIKKWIRLQNGTIYLGEEGNQLGVEIDNEELRFMDGGVKVAYITGKSLYITSAIIVDNLQIGNHRFKRWGTSNKYTVVEYVGG